MNQFVFVSVSVHTMNTVSKRQRGYRGLAKTVPYGGGREKVRR